MKCLLTIGCLALIAGFGAAAKRFTPVGSEWLLVDLNGSSVLKRVPATLAFFPEGRVAGRGSCNRFTGKVTLGEGTIELGPLAATRMACADNARMEQETKYLAALGAAERWEWHEPFLLVYSKGQEKPLRFKRQGPAAAKP